MGIPRGALGAILCLAGTERVHIWEACRELALIEANWTWHRSEKQEKSNRQMSRELSRIQVKRKNDFIPDCLYWAKKPVEEFLGR